jgi:uncharacterized protein YacL
MLDSIQSVAIVILAGILVYKVKPNTARPGKSREVILDSCALIDGRVVELARSGFLPETLLVPQFILAELQLLADGSDSHKRERARFGLEIVQQLQKEPSLQVQIARDLVSAKTTDEKLVLLAKKLGADLFTTDFNLNQVASIEGVRVLNINELSHAMRPVALPGEDFEIKIVQAGSNRDQGVGYLEDGTMVVVDNARRDIGGTIKVKVTKSHQTVAGKMLFGQKVSSSESVKQSKLLPTEQKGAKPAPSNRRRTQSKPVDGPQQSNVDSMSPRLRKPRNQSFRSHKERAEASLLDAIDTHGE